MVDPEQMVDGWRQDKDPCRGCLGVPGKGDAGDAWDGFSAVNAWDQGKMFGPEESTGCPFCVPNDMVPKPESPTHSASQEEPITPCLSSEVPSRSTWI